MTWPSAKINTSAFSRWIILYRSDEGYCFNVQLSHTVCIIREKSNANSEVIWRKGSLLWTSHAVVQIITTAVSFCFICLLFSFYDSGYRWCACRPLYLYLANVFFFSSYLFCRVCPESRFGWSFDYLPGCLSVRREVCQPHFDLIL